MANKEEISAKILEIEDLVKGIAIDFGKKFPRVLDLSLPDAEKWLGGIESHVQQDRFDDAALWGGKALKYIREFKNILEKKNADDVTEIMAKVDLAVQELLDLLAMLK